VSLASEHVLPTGESIAGEGDRLKKFSKIFMQPELAAATEESEDFRGAHRNRFDYIKVPPSGGEPRRKPGAITGK
jgi:hypothetical protein